MTFALTAGARLGQIPEEARPRRITFCGLGSLGGQSADAFARMGFLDLIGIDTDTFGAENICRHVLGTNAVGEPKPLAMAKHLARINPDLRFTPVSTNVDVDPAAIEELVAASDVVLGCTDDFRVHTELNRMALLHRVPAVYGTVFDGAAGGKVVLVDPSTDGGCLHCSEGTSGVSYNVPGQGPRYGVDGPWVGLAPFVRRIAEDMVWAALWVLCRDLPGNGVPPPPGPHVTTTFVELREGDRRIAGPGAINVARSPILPDCPYCAAAGRTPVTNEPHPIG